MRDTRHTSDAAIKSKQNSRSPRSLGSAQRKAPRHADMEDTAAVAVAEVSVPFKDKSAATRASQRAAHASRREVKVSAELEPFIATPAAPGRGCAVPLRGRAAVEEEAEEEEEEAAAAAAAAAAALLIACAKARPSTPSTTPGSMAAADAI